MKLHPDTIEAVKQRADIYEVISEHIVLRKQGKEFLGLCPFHDEKTPSFHVNPSKQMYYCFGCGKGGNAITFLKEFGKQSFTEVVLELAQRYQVQVQTFAPEQRQELQRQLSLREQLSEILAVTTAFFQHALRQPQGEAALTYLKVDRQFDDETIAQFQLGYAPEGWETLYGYLVYQKNYPVELVEQAGLIIPRSGGTGYYDRFRNRLMIPILDGQGRPIAFGGRTLTDEQPKYLNSPETELFEKGKTLFALDKAKDAIAKSDRAVVVEGYFDAIALHAAGISQVVAALGTALSLAQVKQLLRYTESKQVILNFDADKAGVKATERAIGEIRDLAYQGEVQLRILNLPEGKDADEFLRSTSPDAYQQLLQNAPLWLDWQIDRTASDRDLNQADSYHQVVQDLVGLIEKITNSNTRTYYVNKCAELLSLGDSRRVPLLVENLVARLRKNRPHNEPRYGNTGRNSSSLPPLPLDSERSLLEQAESLILRVYIHCPEARSHVVSGLLALEDREIYLSFSHHRFLWQQILELQESGAIELTSIESTSLISYLQDKLVDFPQELQYVSPLLYLDEKLQREIERPQLVIRASLACIERVMCQKRYRYLVEMWRKTDCATEFDLAHHYQQQIYTELIRLKSLDRQRQTSFEDLMQFLSFST